MSVQVTSPKFKYLIAIDDASVREHIANLVKNHLADATVYIAKDGADAIHKLEADLPHILILGDKLARRSPEQIIASIYHDPRTSGIQTIFIGNPEKLADHQDLVTTGQLQIIELSRNFGPFIAAVYKALNRIDPQNLDFKLRYMRKGDIFLHEGEKATNLFLLMKGKLSAFTGNPGSPKVLGYINPGEFVGEMAYINHEPRVASVVAEEDSELVEFNIETFDQILYRKPSWMKAMLQTLSRRVKSLNVRRNQNA